jgi:hypothetical protein
VFIFWDRLFGTFQEEDDDEPVIFGVTTPLASWNPLWANLQFYAQLWADARRTESLWDKLRIWFMPPVGARRMWRRLIRTQAGPGALSQVRGALHGMQQLYVVVQFAVYVALGSYLMDVAERVPTPR